MRNYAKVGGKKGKPGYRTPAAFRYCKFAGLAGRDRKKGTYKKMKNK